MATHSIFLPGELHGQRSLAGYSPWGHKELDTTEQHTHTHTHTHKGWSRKTGLRRRQRRSDTWEESWKMNFTGQRHRKWDGQAGRETNICVKILQSPWHIWGNWNISVWILKSLTEHFGLYPIGTWDKLLSWERMLDIWFWHYGSKLLSYSLVYSGFFEDALSSQALFMDSERSRMVCDPMIGVQNLVG